MNKDIIISILVGLIVALLLGKYNGETPTWLWIIVIIIWIPVILLWIYKLKEKRSQNNKKES